MATAIQKLTFLQRTACLSSRLCMRRMLSIAPPSETSELTLSPKLENLVQEITKLTLLEVSELNNALKRTLNLPDVTPAAFGAIPTATAPVAEEVAQAAKVSYTVKLIKFDNAKKTGLIKEIKSLLEDMNLVQAKKFIESAPVVVKANINKEEAEKLKETLAAYGAECTID